MPATIAPLFNLYLLSPGRRIYALDRVRPLAEAREAKAIVVAISQATAHDREVRKLDARRRRGPNPVPPSAVRHDGEVDRTLDALDALLAYRVDRDGADSFAQVMRAELFPRGVKLHKRLPLAEQLVANQEVLELLESEQHAAWLDAQGLRPLIEDLRGSHEAFAQALAERDQAVVPSFAEVRSARARGQELYLRVVIEILAAYFEDEVARAELLAPIFAQNEEVRRLRRRRRPLIELDPDTGEPEDELEPDAGEPEQDLGPDSGESEQDLDPDIDEPEQELEQAS